MVDSYSVLVSIDGSREVKRAIVRCMVWESGRVIKLPAIVPLKWYLNKIGELKESALKS